MTTINQDIVTTFVTKTGSALGATNNTPINIAANLAGYEYTCPDANVIATKDGTTLEFSVASLLLRSVLKDELNPAQLQFGQIITNIVCPELAVIPFDFGATTTTTVRTNVIKTITPDQQLLLDIKTAFDAEIASIAEYYKTIANDASLQADYLQLVTDNQELKIYTIAIDATKTAALITSAKFAETLEQIQSVFVGTKTAVDCEVSSDSKSIACNLMQWDKNNAETILAKLATFGFKAVFDKDSTKVLARLQAQILTITL
jgi:hypothetical protein